MIALRKGGLERMMRTARESDHMFMMLFVQIMFVFCSLDLFLLFSRVLKRPTHTSIFQVYNTHVEGAPVIWFSMGFWAQ